MKNFILFDGDFRQKLLPLTYTRPVADLRVGILTIREKWEWFLKNNTSTLTQDYLSGKYPAHLTRDTVFIWGSLLPTKDLVTVIEALDDQQVLVSGDRVLAYRANFLPTVQEVNSFTKVEYNHPIDYVENLWDIFQKNDLAIKADFQLITAGRTSAPIPPSVNVLSPENIFLEEGAKLEFVTLNASTGPIYIGRDTEIMEGSVIRGPFALCDHAQVKLATKIYGATTVGPHCRVGGEVNNSVMMGYSNKGHDGFLGNSVLGEWCNLGADTNNSNLKNNYDNVKLWSYQTESMQNTGLQFCGLVMGDHSKSGINTMFNTGTVVGVCSNIYGGGFPPNFIPSFAWGGADGFTSYRTDKAFETVKVVMSRRSVDFTREDQNILEEVFKQSQKYRDNL